MLTNATNVNAVIVNTNLTSELAAGARQLTRDVFSKWLELESRQDDTGGGEIYQGSNSVVYILRFGGVAAMMAAVLTWRLAKRLRHR